MHVGLDKKDSLDSTYRRLLCLLKTIELQMSISLRLGLGASIVAIYIFTMNAQSCSIYFDADDK